MEGPDPEELQKNIAPVCIDNNMVRCGSRSNKPF